MHVETLDHGTIRRAEQAMRDEAHACSGVVRGPTVVGRRGWADWYGYYLRRGLGHGEAAERAAQRVSEQKPAGALLAFRREA